MMETPREKGRAGLRVGGTMGVGAAGIVVLQYAGLPPEVAGAIVVLVGFGLRYLSSALGIGGMAGLVLLAAVLPGCAGLQPQSPQAAIDAGCEAGLHASQAALLYLQSPDGRDDSAEDRERVVQAITTARDACFAGRAALQGEGSPEEQLQRLQTALLRLAGRVPALESDPQFAGALARLLETAGALREEASR